MVAPIHVDGALDQACIGGERKKSTEKEGRGK